MISSPIPILFGFLIFGFAASSCLDRHAELLRDLEHRVAPGDDVDLRRRRGLRGRDRRRGQLLGGLAMPPVRRRRPGCSPPMPRSIGPTKNSARAARTTATAATPRREMPPNDGRPDPGPQRRVGLVPARRLPGGPEQLGGVLRLGRGRRLPGDPMSARAWAGSATPTGRRTRAAGFDGGASPAGSAAADPRRPTPRRP